jgi:DUF971 family protein
MTDPQYVPKAIRSPRGARTTEIDWADGHKGVYPHAILRGYCPCAGCQGHSGTITFIPYDESNGALGLEIVWFDGHASGIYSYTYLRALCQCSECNGPHGETIPR